MRIGAFGSSYGSMVEGPAVSCLDETLGPILFPDAAHEARRAVTAVFMAPGRAPLEPVGNLTPCSP